jgi:hypothetical protein
MYQVSLTEGVPTVLYRILCLMLCRFSAASVYFDAVEAEAPGGPGAPSPPSSLSGMGELQHTANVLDTLSRC